MSNTGRVIDPLDTETADAIRQARADADKLARLREVEDVKWLMSSKRGRRIVYRLLQQAGVFRSSFNTNAMQMAFNEGNRNQGLKLLADVTEQSPERYAEMIDEARQ